MSAEKRESGMEHAGPLPSSESSSLFKSYFSTTRNKNARKTKDQTESKQDSLISESKLIYKMVLRGEPQNRLSTDN